MRSTVVFLLLFYASVGFTQGDCAPTPTGLTEPESTELESLVKKDSEYQQKLNKLNESLYAADVSTINGINDKIRDLDTEYGPSSEKRVKLVEKKASCAEYAEARKKAEEERKRLQAAQEVKENKVTDPISDIKHQSRDQGFGNNPPPSSPSPSTYGSRPAIQPSSSPAPSSGGGGPSQAPSYGGSPLGNMMPSMIQAQQPARERDYRDDRYDDEDTSFDSVFNQAAGGETQYQQEPQDEFIPGDSSGAAPAFAERSENPFDDITYDTRNKRKKKAETVVGDEFVDPATITRGNGQAAPNYQNPHANPFIGNGQAGMPQQVAHYQHPTGRADEPNDTGAETSQVSLSTGSPSGNLRPSKWSPFKGSASAGKTAEEMKPENVALKPTQEQERKKKIEEEELEQLPTVKLQEDEGGGGSGFFAGLAQKVSSLFGGDDDKEIEKNEEKARKQHAYQQRQREIAEQNYNAEKAKQQAKAKKAQAKAAAKPKSDEPEEKGFFDKVFDISSWFGSDDDEAEGDEQYEDMAAYVEKDPVFDDQLSNEEIARQRALEEAQGKSIRELAAAKSRAGDKLPALDDGPAEETPHLENNYGIYGLDN